MKMRDFSSQQLSKKQMTQVTGGGAFFSCECIGANNSPFIGEWVGFYDDTKSMQADIKRMCQTGGTCDKTYPAFL